MGRRSFTAAEKIVLAEGWAAARTRGEGQEAFAARVGVDARRVRQFVREYGRPDVAAEVALWALQDAIGILQRAATQLQTHEAARRAAPESLDQRSNLVSPTGAPVIAMPTLVDEVVEFDADDGDQFVLPGSVDHEGGEARSGTGAGHAGEPSRPRFIWGA